MATGPRFGAVAVCLAMMADRWGHGLRAWTEKSTYPRLEYHLPRGGPVSGNSTSYILYLREPITVGTVERIYDLLDRPHFTLNHPREDCVSFTFDHLRYIDQRPSTDFCWIHYKDLLEILLLNHDLPGDQDGLLPLEPFLGNGERQFEVMWHNVRWTALWAFPDDEWDDLAEFFDLMIDVMRTVEPFFGILGHDYQFETEYLGYEVTPEERFVDVKRILSHVPSGWASLFVDDALYREIGADHIEEWAEVIIPVSDLGHLLERDARMFGGTDPAKKHLERRGEVFMEHFYQPIIRRLEAEFYPR